MESFTEDNLRKLEELGLEIRSIHDYDTPQWLILEASKRRIFEMGK